jgi:hypothetical protein
VRPRSRSPGKPSFTSTTQRNAHGGGGACPNSRTASFLRVVAINASDLYCPRCDSSVGVIRVWHGWKWCWRVWLGGLIVLLAMTPLIAYDFCILIPGMMVYISAGGPLWQLSRTRPVCRKCSLELMEGETTGTPMKRKRRSAKT